MHQTKNALTNLDRTIWKLHRDLVRWHDEDALKFVFSGTAMHLVAIAALPDGTTAVAKTQNISLSAPTGPFDSAHELLQETARFQETVATARQNHLVLIKHLTECAKLVQSFPSFAKLNQPLLLRASVSTNNGCADIRAIKRHAPPFELTEFAHLDHQNTKRFADQVEFLETYEMEGPLYPWKATWKDRSGFAHENTLMAPNGKTARTLGSILFSQRMFKGSATVRKIKPRQESRTP